MSAKSALFPNSRDIADKILKEHFSKPVVTDSFALSRFDVSVSLCGRTFRVRVLKHFEPGNSLLLFVSFDSEKQVISFVSTLLYDLKEAASQRRILREAKGK